MKRVHGLHGLHGLRVHELHEFTRRCRGIFLFTAICCLLFVFGCDDIFNAQQDQLPEGYGSFTLLTGDADIKANARAIVPVNVTFPGGYLLEFNATGGGAVSKDEYSTGNTPNVKLKAGEYTLQVTAYSEYNSASDNKPAARSGEISVTITAGENNAASVPLSAVNNDGEGTFSWDITFPAVLQEAYMTITPQEDTEEAFEAEFGSADPLTRYFIGGGEQVANPGFMALPSGNYDVKFVLIKDAESRAITWPETLHIYMNLASHFEKDFSGYNFNNKGFLVTLDYNDDDDATVTVSEYLFYGETLADVFTFLEPTNDKEELVFKGWYIVEDGEPTNTKWEIDAPVDRELYLIAKWGEGVFVVYDIEDIIPYLESAEGGDATNNPVYLPVGLDLGNMQTDSNWEQLLDALNTAGKYVDLDLSACTMIGTVDDSTFDPRVNTSSPTSVGKNRIVSLVLPDIAVSIANGTTVANNDGAFRNFSSLISVDLNNVESIGDYAFQNRTSLTGTFTIPDSVNSIGNSAFNGCSSLASVTIGNSVESIGNGAFSGCSSLASVTIGNSVESIGNNAFYNCTNLVGNITIPNRVTSIGLQAFYGCNKITSVTIGNSVESIGNSAFSGCSSLASVTIGNSVEIIGDNAFYNCSNLVGNITIPNRVTSIGQQAFYNCSKITSVTLGNSVQTIGTSAFQNTGITGSLTIPNSVISIGASAFCGLSGIISISLGNSVQTIGSIAFADTSITSVTIPNSVISIGNRAFGGDNYRSMDQLITVTLGNSVQTIGDNAFAYTGITSINIPDSVTSIGNNAFRECSSLKTVTLGNNVETIGNSAFMYTALTGSINLPSVISIGNFAFYNLTSITITLGSGVQTIGNEAFRGGIRFSGPINIPNIISIGDRAFQSAINIGTSITIPSSATMIGSYAFYGTGIIQVVFSGDSTTFVNDSFGGGTLRSLYLTNGAGRYDYNSGISNWVYSPN